jgi:hypothetical protein
MVYQLSITSIAEPLACPTAFYILLEKHYLHFSAVRRITYKELVADEDVAGITNRVRVDAAFN